MEGRARLSQQIFPGGYLMGGRGTRHPKYGIQDHLDLIQVDGDGNVMGEFNRAECIEDPGQKPRWLARQHHDFLREGNPLGSYAPGPASPGRQPVALSVQSAELSAQGGDS